MYTLYKFHFLNGISEINQLFDDILIIWPAPVYLVKTGFHKIGIEKSIVQEPVSNSRYRYRKFLNDTQP